MHTTDKGEVARYMTVTHLMKMGYIVSVPLTENSSYDLIADDGQRLYRIQVKKATLHKDKIKINLYTNNYNKNVEGSIKKYTSNEIDWVIGVYIEENKFYKIDYLSKEFDNKSALILRLAAPKINHPNCKYATDYEF